MLVNNFWTRLVNTEWLERLLLLLFIALLGIVLVNYWGISIWRQDSMYYVDSYTDKLSQEGRWINYVFFPWLKQVPAPLAILVSYLTVIYFCYYIFLRVTANHYFSGCFGILCSLVPILPVQMQWPETLLIGFLLLPISAYFSKRIPYYVFFPLTALLFFGTFSAFYFLMPLLFLAKLNRSLFLRIVACWILSFCLAYLLTNIIVWQMTGASIQIASWRSPNYITDWNSLLGNVSQFISLMQKQWAKISIEIGVEIVFAAFVFGIFSAIYNKAYVMVLAAVMCALAVYVSVIPVGIEVQYRSLLTAFIGIFTALFLRSYHTKKWLHLALIIMLLLAARMAWLSYEAIAWYKYNTRILLAEFSQVLPAQPEQVERLFIVADGDEALAVVKHINSQFTVRPRFSEGFAHPIFWLPVLWELGFTEIRICTNAQGWDCQEAWPSYEKRIEKNLHGGLFIGHKIAPRDFVVMINPEYARIR